MRLPAIALDHRGFVVDANAAAEVVFDDNIKIKDRRLFIRDVAARTLLKDTIDQLKDLPRHCGAGYNSPHGQITGDRADLAVRGPVASAVAGTTILAKTFHLTHSEAKLACIIARGAPPDIAARELKISRETARDQLKSVFAERYARGEIAKTEFEEKRWILTEE
jgi:DNA-binding CsgD family transcriptional regulator